MSDLMLARIQRHNAGLVCDACGYYHHPEDECGMIDRARGLRRPRCGPADLPDPPTFNDDVAPGTPGVGRGRDH